MRTYSLASLPHVPLLLGPTPLQRLDRLRAFLGGESAGIPPLFIKRDDLTPLALGGNKLRKLEWLAGDALSQNADTLITAGAAQSNHCRQTAAVAALLQMECHLMLRGPEPNPHTGNLILNDWLGAHLSFAAPGESVADKLAPLAEALRAAGKRPYTIPIGGSNAVGAVGYVRAAQELTEQLPVATHIVVATGSGGTQAGLEVGVRLYQPAVKILGIGVAEPDTESWQRDIATLANATARRLSAAVTVSPDDIHCPLDWMGTRYGEPTPAGQEAIRLLARTEGIFLDPVYSAKAFAALLDRVRGGEFTPSDHVVFWHTGGTPALFAA